MSAVEPLFRCEHCKRAFNKESHYQKHECKERVRALEMETVEGKLAYAQYRMWLKKRKLKPSDNAKAFQVSSTYTAFQKFARWVRRTGIVDVELYIELMVDRKIAPSNWTHDFAYADYINHFDHQVPPLKQVDITIETLTILSDELGVPLNKVLEQFEMPLILELIQQRRLSPWLLFSMKSFKLYYNGLNETDRKHLMDGISASTWSDKFGKQPKLMEGIREIAEGLQL